MSILQLHMLLSSSSLFSASLAFPHPQHFLFKIFAVCGFIVLIGIVSNVRLLKFPASNT